MAKVVATSHSSHVARDDLSVSNWRILKADDRPLLAGSNPLDMARASPTVGRHHATTRSPGVMFMVGGRCYVPGGLFQESRYSMAPETMSSLMRCAS
jgi:hypothetical protein